ncbi:MAG: CpaF family protein [Candidatus Dormibacteria bacterium]
MAEQLVAVAREVDMAEYYRALGPLGAMLNDPSVTEIMVNGPDTVVVEQNGQLLRSSVRFESEQQLLDVITFIVKSIGRQINDASPLCDARLADGSRVNAVIPPLALDGPLLTIRKFATDPLKASDLIGFGTMSAEAAAFLETCVLAKCNIIVSGGTGTGKTTLLNVLSGFIPDDERIVTIEDAAELQLKQWHVVRLESRPAGPNGTGRVPIRDLVVNSLRMRPDRIVVGECRSGEAFDMLQAMNTGHDGSLTTVHSNSPRDALSRLETLVLMAGMDLPMSAIRQQIAAALNIVVQLNRLRDGSRKVTAITELLGMEGEKIVLQDIFTYQAMGADENGKIVGEFRSTGVRPATLQKLAERGVRLPAALQEMFPERRSQW